MNSPVRHVFSVLIVLTAFCAVNVPAFAQQMTDYSFSASSGVFTPIAGTAVSVSADAVSGAVPIGFKFLYMGTWYSNVYLCSNGVLTFNAAAAGHSGETFTERSNLDSADTWMLPLLAPLWDSTLTGGTISYVTEGATGSRVFTCEWLASQWGGSPGAAVSFHVKLYEADGRIEFVYRPESSDPSSAHASIGMAAGTEFRSLDGTGASPNASGTVEYDNLSAKPAEGRIYAFTPNAPAAPSSFAAVTGGLGMTISWSDTPDELRYEVYKSTDGLVYYFADSLAANTTSYTVRGLLPSTTVYWKIHAIREFISPALAGSATTAAPSLSGTKTVGPTGTYATLTAALADLSFYGLAADVTLELQSGYTSGSETLPLLLQAAADPQGINSSASALLTIRPAAGAAGLSITGNADPAVLRLDGADYVVIDGRPGGTGTAAELTLENLNNGSFSAVAFSSHSSHCVIRYCTLRSIDTVGNKGVVNFGVTTHEDGSVYNTIDHCDIDAAQSGSGIYSGFSSEFDVGPNGYNTISNNRIHDFFTSGTRAAVCAGIILNYYSQAWTITGNHFFQTISRAYASATSTSYGISITNGSQHVIENNFFGGSAPSAGGTPWTVLSGGVKTMMIYNSNSGSGTISIQGNTFTNFDIHSSLLAAGDMFNAMYIAAGTANIGTSAGNTIGSATATGAITVTSTTGGTFNAMSLPKVGGIYCGAAGVCTIANNIIGGITVSSTNPANAVLLYGIIGSTGGGAISGNSIGSTSTANSILNSSGGTATLTASLMYGIYSRNGTSDITGNTVANMRCSSASSVLTCTGIYISDGKGVERTIAGNTVRALRHDGVRSSATAMQTVGMYFVPGSGAQYTITDNRVSNLSTSDSTTSGIVSGIWVNGGSMVNVERNIVHSLQVASASATVSAFITGNGTITYRNNVARIGLDNDGAAITTPAVFRGFDKRTTSACRYDNNTVYIGGTGILSGAKTTAAWYREASGADVLANNIFVNARTSVDSTGAHYAVYSTSPSSLTMDYNIYQSAHRFATLDNGAMWLAAITDIRNQLPGQDLHSCIGDPNFVNPAGSGAAFDLHPHETSPAEGAGFALDGVTVDCDNTARSTLTPSDIGAYAFNGTVVDYFTPNFSSATLTPGRMLPTRAVTGVVITDIGTGVPVSGSLVPRLWYRNKTLGSTWASCAGTLASGTGNSGTWSFTIDYAPAGGTPSANDTIQYYYAAQDLASPSHLWYIPYFGASHTDVTAQTAPPSTPLEYFIYKDLSGTIRVPGDYASLSCDGGFFSTLDRALLAGDLNILVTDTLVEDGTHAFTSVYQETPGTYHMTIRPDTSEERLIVGETPLPLITLSGIMDVRIDGRYNGSGTFLRLRNKGEGSAIRLIYDASNNAITHCVLEGNQTATVVDIAEGSITGNDNNTIDSCVIQGRSDSAAAPPPALVASVGFSAAVANSGNTISNCTLSGFSIYGIHISPYGNEDWTITGNTIRGTGEQSVDVYGISTGGLGRNSTITGNTIHDITTTAANAYGINIDGSEHLTISKNTFHTIYSTATGGYSMGIYMTSANAGTSVITNNSFSLMTPAGNASYLLGVYDQSSTDSITCDYNTFYLGGFGTADLWSDSYYKTSTGFATLRNNIFITARKYGGGVYEIPLADENNGGWMKSDNNLHIGIGSAGSNFFWLMTAGSPEMDYKTWRNTTGNDSASWVLHASNFNADSLFVDAATGNLAIRPGSTAAWLVNGRGLPLTSVGDDFNGTPRSTSIAAGPTDIGAFEVTPTTAPPPVAFDKVPAKGDSTLYTYAGRTVCVLRWDTIGTVPDSVLLCMYPGSTLPPTTRGLHGSGYWDLTAYGGTDYKYGITLYFDDAGMGTISSKANIRLAKRTDSEWQHCPQTSLNPSQRSLTIAGLTSFSQFALSDNADPLPVELAEFIAAVNAGDVTLRWKTATELCNAGFGVERRSLGSTEWQQIGFVSGSGTSNAPVEYAYKDAKPAPGSYAYRLKQVDQNGLERYSLSVEAVVEVPRVFTLAQNYPNPFNPATTIEFTLANDGIVHLRLFDILGREVKTLVNGALKAGQRHKVVLDARTLSSGTYFYKLESGPDVRVRKMLLLK